MSTSKKTKRGRIGKVGAALRGVRGMNQTVTISLKRVLALLDQHVVETLSPPWKTWDSEVHVTDGDQGIRIHYTLCLSPRLRRKTKPGSSDVRFNTGTCVRLLERHYGRAVSRVTAPNDNPNVRKLTSITIHLAEGS